MRPTHWLILILVALLLFGAQKLPDLARALGRSAKILKEEVSDLTSDSSGDDQPPSATK